jgi:hypothetical protein
VNRSWMSEEVEIVTFHLLCSAAASATHPPEVSLACSQILQAFLYEHEHWVRSIRPVAAQRANQSVHSSRMVFQGGEADADVELVHPLPCLPQMWQGVGKFRSGYL